MGVAATLPEFSEWTLINCTGKSKRQQSMGLPLKVFQYYFDCFDVHSNSIDQWQTLYSHLKLIIGRVHSKLSDCRND